MIHNEISHHGPNIAHRSLSQKPVQDGCPSGEHPPCSFNYVVDITRHYKATGNTAQVVLSRKLWKIEIIWLQTANTKRRL